MNQIAYAKRLNDSGWFLLKFWIFAGLFVFVGTYVFFSLEQPVSLKMLFNIILGSCLVSLPYVFFFILSRNIPLDKETLEQLANYQWQEKNNLIWKIEDKPLKIYHLMKLLKLEN